MTQYLSDFNLKFEDIMTSNCQQVFGFGLSRKNISSIIIEIPIGVRRIDSKEGALKVQT